MILWIVWIWIPNNDNEKFNSLLQKIDDLTKINFKLSSDNNQLKLKLAEIQWEKFTLSQANK